MQLPEDVPYSKLDGLVRLQLQLRIAGDWKQAGMALKMDRSSLDNIEYSERRAEDCAYKLLNTKASSTGRQFNVGMILNCFEGSGVQSLLSAAGYLRDKMGMPPRVMAPVVPQTVVQPVDAQNAPPVVQAKDSHECSVCLDHAVDSTIACGHAFCGSCLNTLPQKICPKCRLAFVQVNKLFL